MNFLYLTGLKNKNMNKSFCTHASGSMCII